MLRIMICSENQPKGFTYDNILIFLFIESCVNFYALALLSKTLASVDEKIIPTTFYKDEIVMFW